MRFAVDGIVVNGISKQAIVYTPAKPVLPQSHGGSESTLQMALPLKISFAKLAPVTAQKLATASVNFAREHELPFDLPESISLCYSMAVK